MEQGSLRCDANISLRRKDEEKLGTKTEVKNMNSFHNLQRALNYEIERQRALLERGEEIIQETRLWSEEKRRTYSMRGKEEAHDYRYFPEPDLPPIEITPEYLSSIRATLPELPEARKKRFQTQYQLPLYDAEVLTSQPALADYFESCAKIYPHFKTISNWIMTSLLSQLKEHNEEIENSRVKPKQLVELLQLIQEGVISGKIAKEIFEEMYKSGKNASEIVKERSLTQITEETELKRIITEVLEENQAVVAEYKAGKTKVFTFLVGQVMKKTHGKANPRIVTELLKNFLTT
jgi:aspartyl-tRNA(Asn)/glutamyl-tRNA(Gln) amidotransferase subunit B